MKPCISPDELRKLLQYERATGRLFWLVRLSNRVAVGQEAGTPNADGHRQVRIHGKIYYAHRIIWAMETGEWPAFEVDHRNRKRGDNRWANLRPATPEQNRRNNGGRPRANGLPQGVYTSKGGTYRACITHKGKSRHLGCFDTVAEALFVRVETEKRLFGDFARQR